MENELPDAAPVESSHSNASLIATLQSSLESSEEENNNLLIQRAYGFTVAGCNFLVEQGLYTELITEFNVSSLPNTPDHFLGLTNVRGNLVPVYQIESLFEIKTTTKSNFAFLFDLPSKGAAIVIEDKPQPINMSTMLAVEHKGSKEQIPPYFHPAITKTYTDQNTIWHMLNHSLLFKYLAQFI